MQPVGTAVPNEFESVAVADLRADRRRFGAFDRVQVPRLGEIVTSGVRLGDRFDGEGDGAAGNAIRIDRRERLLQIVQVPFVDERESVTLAKVEHGRFVVGARIQTHCVGDSSAVFEQFGCMRRGLRDAVARFALQTLHEKRAEQVPQLYRAVVPQREQTSISGDAA